MVAAASFSFGKIHSVPRVSLLVAFPQTVSNILGAVLSQLVTGYFGQHPKLPRENKKEFNFISGFQHRTEECE